MGKNRYQELKELSRDREAQPKEEKMLMSF